MLIMIYNFIRRQQRLVFSGCSEVWYRAWFGTKRPRVQIPALRPYWNASIDTILAFLFFWAKSAWCIAFRLSGKKISIIAYLIRSKNPCPDGIITVQAKLLGATMTLIFWLSVIVRVKCHGKSLVSSCLLGIKNTPHYRLSNRG